MALTSASDGTKDEVNAVRERAVLRKDVYDPIHQQQSRHSFSQEYLFYNQSS